ncbi:MAG: hypothetical protein ACYTF1_18300 [Planctomycetota bacterium]|jgi:hypothetical protein
MDKQSEPDYLQPPHIQLGFYWQSITEVYAYRNTLHWLLENGYDMHPVVTAVRSKGGEIPRFAQLATHGLPKDDVRLFYDWTANKAMTDNEWFPVKIRLAPNNSENVDVDLNYALIYEESFKLGQPHAIEITASGADLNLLDNSSDGELEPEIVINAQKTEKWHKTIFRNVCEGLQPNYAGLYWERSLQPPASLLASEDIINFGSLFLSNKVDEPDKIALLFKDLSNWSTEKYLNGIYVCLLRSDDDKQSQKGREIICNLLK